MLHILLLILKIIGWILLAILILAVLLICVVLFVPFKYKAKGSCQGDISTLYGHIRFSWLLHLFSGHVEYENGSLKWKFRIAWKQFRNEDNADKSDEADAIRGTASDSGPGPESAGKEVSRTGAGDAKEQEHPGSPEMEDVKTEENGNKDIGREDTGPEDIRGVGIGTEDTIREDTDTEYKRRESTSAEQIKRECLDTEGIKREGIGTEETKGEGTCTEDINRENIKKDGIFRKLIRMFEKIRKRLEEIYQKIKYTFHKIYVNIKILLHRKDKLLLFITDETHKSAFCAALVEIRRLLKFLKPRHLKVSLCFGFSDPCITGQIFALISMLGPYVKGQKELLPDFEQKILKGTAAFSGKVRVLYAVLSFWRLLTNKKVRITYKHIRKFKL